MKPAPPVTRILFIASLHFGQRGAGAEESLVLVLEGHGERAERRGIEARRRIHADVMNLPSESVRLATVALAMLPILVVYPFLQRYFIKGVMLGAIKG